MGGLGAGHKSERARRSRLVNIQKARAARKRAPLPWRSGVESRIIEQLVWQWWMTKDSGQWSAFAKARQGGQASARQASGEERQQQTSRNSGEWLGVSGQRQDRGKAASSSGYARHGGQAGVREADRRTPYRDRPWAKYRVARFLGVSHTWVNKLVKRFEADPERMRRKMRAFAPATFEKLERAREETRRQRELGWLRGPIRWRRVKVTLEGKKKTVVAVTRAARLRQGYGEASPLEGRQGYGEANPLEGRQGYGEANPLEGRQGYGEASPLEGRQGYGEASGRAVRHAHIDAQRDSASRALRSRHGGQASGQAGKPRPVPFAFRRRR